MTLAAHTHLLGLPQGTADPYTIRNRRGGGNTICRISCGNDGPGNDAPVFWPDICLSSCYPRLQGSL